MNHDHFHKCAIIRTPKCKEPQASKWTTGRVNMKLYLQMQSKFLTALKSMLVRSISPLDTEQLATRHAAASNVGPCWPYVSVSPFVSFSPSPTSAAWAPWPWRYLSTSSFSELKLSNTQLIILIDLLQNLHRHDIQWYLFLSFLLVLKRTIKTLFHSPKVSFRKSRARFLITSVETLSTQRASAASSPSQAVV